MPLMFQSFPAPAKLNLMLRVLDRRPDGYHTLETVFRLIDLNDRLDIALSEKSDITLIDEHSGIPLTDNLVMRAARLFQKTTKITQGFTIRLTKHIPVGAGLGGGSSDAATTLMALNQLCQTKLSRETLMYLGRQLGADVPFFIFGQNARGEGIGDTLTAMTLPDCWYVLLSPPVEIATKQAFSLLKLTRKTPPAIIPALSDGYLHFNDLEPVVRKHFKQVDDAMVALERYGAPRMTGSGSCVFLACDDATSAEQIGKACVGNWRGYWVRGLSHHPLYHTIQ